jgi:hypothetical protein
MNIHSLITYYSHQQQVNKNRENLWGPNRKALESVKSMKIQRPGDLSSDWPTIPSPPLFSPPVDESEGIRSRSMLNPADEGLPPPAWFSTLDVEAGVATVAGRSCWKWVAGDGCGWLHRRRDFRCRLIADVVGAVSSIQKPLNQNVSFRERKK